MHDLDPLYLYGLTGCGKTTPTKQFIVWLNYPTFEITGYGRLELAGPCSRTSLRKGNMVYEHGPSPFAILYGGILLISEADLFSSEVAVSSNGVLGDTSLCSSENEGEVISPYETFRIVCITNVNGGGDDTGLHQGAVR